MTRSRQHYRVSLTSWDLWEVWLDASSEEEAFAEARRLYDEIGASAFRHRNCGVDGVDAELWSEGGAQ